MTVEDPRCQESDSLVNRMINQITVVMKKFVLTSLLVLGGALSVPAQSRQENLLAEDDAVSAGKEDLKDDRGTVLFSNRLPYRYEVNIGWAGYPGSSALSDCFSDLFYDRYVNSTSPSGSMGDIYADYAGPLYSTGNIAAEFNIQFRKWFALGLQAGAEGRWSPVYSSDTGEKIGKYSGMLFYFIPYARFTYLNHRVVKLYSAVGVGVGAGYMRNGGTGYIKAASSVVGQVIPIGIMLGTRVYGLFETGIGSMYCGCRVGIGYRF